MLFAIIIIPKNHGLFTLCPCHPTIPSKKAGYCYDDCIKGYLSIGNVHSMWRALITVSNLSLFNSAMFLAFRC